MKVYLVILEDRHTDVQVGVFSTLDKAVASLHDILEDYAVDKSTPDDLPDHCKWLYSFTLNGEGDAVRVEEVEVDSDAV